MTIEHEGQAFHGVGEKQRENGQPIPRAAGRPLRIQGTVAAGGVISATFQEEGWSRPSTGQFRLRLQDHLPDGDICQHGRQGPGIITMDRTSAPVAHASRRDQPGQDGAIGPLPSVRMWHASAATIQPAARTGRGSRPIPWLLWTSTRLLSTGQASDWG